MQGPRPISDQAEGKKFLFSIAFPALIVLNEASIAFYKVSTYILQSQSRVHFHVLQKPLNPILAPVSCWSLAIVFAPVFKVTCQAATTSADNLNTSAESQIDSMTTLDLARS